MINLQSPLSHMACCGYQHVFDEQINHSFISVLPEKEATLAYELVVKQNEIIAPSRQSKPFLIQLNKVNWLVGHALSGHGSLEDLIDGSKVKVEIKKAPDKFYRRGIFWCLEKGTVRASFDNPAAVKFKKTFTPNIGNASPVGYKEIASFGISKHSYNLQYEAIKDSKFDGVIGVTFNEYHKEFAWQIEEVERLLKEENVLYHHEFRNPRYGGHVSTKDSHRLCTVFFKFKGK